MGWDSTITDSLNFALIDAQREYSRLLDVAIQGFLSDYSNENRYDSVIALLQNETSTNRKMQLVEAYIAKGTDSSALSLLNTLSSNTNLSNYCSLTASLIELRQENKNWFDIKNDSALYADVESFAEDSTKFGYMKARAILSKIDGKRYPEIINFDPDQIAYQARKNNSLFSSEKKLIRNYPNPFKAGTVIEAQVSDELVSPKLVFYDMLGKVIREINLAHGFNSFSIQNLKAGVYLYSLVSENKRIQTEKMICTE